MKKENLKKSKIGNIVDIVALLVLIIFFVAMLLVSYRREIGEIFKALYIYKDYENIHSEIDPDMPGYELPIAKNVELVNNRITDSRAYRKYYCIPNEYEKELKELEKDKEQLENCKYCYEDTYFYTNEECGRGWVLDYEIMRAEKVELTDTDVDKGVTDMYDVTFEIVISDSEGEELRYVIYRNIVAKVEEEWIFYDERFSVISTFLKYYEPIEMDIE